MLRAIRYAPIVLLAACGGRNSPSSLDAGTDGATCVTEDASLIAPLCRDPFEAGACSVEVSASAYPQGCNVDSDCSVVRVGPLCNPCNPSCSWGAIRHDSVAQYTSDVNSLAPAMGGAPSCAPCCNEPLFALCQDGGCVAPAICPF